MSTPCSSPHLFSPQKTLSPFISFKVCFCQRNLYQVYTSKSESFNEYASEKGFKASCTCKVKSLEAKQFFKTLPNEKIFMASTLKQISMPL